MNLSKLSPAGRFAMALGASMGVGHIAFQAFTRNLGPVVGLLVGVAAITVVAVGIYLILEGVASKQDRQESAERMSPERMNFEALDRR